MLDLAVIVPILPKGGTATRHFTAQVVGAVPIENEAIYVWLTTAGSPEPRAYVLPWSQQAAQQLQDARGKAEADGTGLEMKMQAADAGLDTREPMFYARPHPALPAKDYQSGVRPLAIHSRGRSRVFRFVFRSCSLGRWRRGSFVSVQQRRDSAQ
ncbi:hypothetical protein [Mesorhizobium argentiipisi]|uniref:Uncharacterized protein n=1 Tax=Mesorhizobium argentiipisi TaxID=3015175 RepID=A0ABU8KAD7_9HYPH